MSASTARGHSFERTARALSAYLLTASCVIAVILLWQWASSSGRVHSIVLPEPGKVARRTRELLSDDRLVRHLRATGREIFVGFSVGALLAVSSALVLGRYNLALRALTPFMSAVQAMPKIVIMPVLAIWFGFGTTAVSVIVALVVFFPIYINTLTGLAMSTSADGYKLMKSLRATEWQSFRQFRVPWALPFIFTGLKTAINYAVVGSVTAEFLGSSEGLGYLVSNAATRFRIVDVYSTVLIISVISALIYLCVELIDRRVVFWRVDLDTSRRPRAVGDRQERRDGPR